MISNRKQVLILVLTLALALIARAEEALTDQDETTDETTTDAPSSAEMSQDEEYEAYDIQGVGGTSPMIDEVIKVITSPPSPEEQNLTAQEKWLLSSERIRKMTSQLTKAMNPYLMQLIPHIRVSGDCANAMLKLVIALQDRKPWAYSMVESIGRLPVGILSGTTASLGDYDQCLETKSADIYDDSTTIHGKYCLLRIRPAMPPMRPKLRLTDPIFNFTGTPLEGTTYDTMAQFAHGFFFMRVNNGLCIPSACDAKDMESVAQMFFKPLFMEVEVSDCGVRETGLNLNAAQIISLSTISLVILVVAFGTAIDWLYRDRKGPEFILGLLRCFSITRNASKVCDLRIHGDPKLSWIHGIRTMTIMWIVVAHSYTCGTIFTSELAYRSISEAKPFSERLDVQVILNGWISVDTFFFISGLIVAYVGLPMFEKHKGKISWFKFVFLRWLRFTPPVVAVIMLNFLWPLFGDGPLFQRYSGEVVDNCYDSWWATLLYVNNWLPIEKMCLRHTWYLSADFQLHIIVYFVLVLILHYRKLGIYMCYFLMSLGIFIPGLIVHLYDLPATPIVNQPNIDEFKREMTYFYFPTFNHMTPYFMGVIFGYGIIRDVKLKLSYNMERLCWMILPALSFATCLVTYVWNGLMIVPDPYTAPLYAGIHRLTWISGIAWILYNCAEGKAPLVNKFLGASFWIPFSRLSYQIYLVHFLLIWYHISTARVPILFRHYNMMFTSTTICVWSVGLALICYLLFEAPFHNLLKMLLTKGDDQHEQSSIKTDKQPSNNNLRSEKTLNTEGSVNAGYTGSGGQLSSEEEFNANMISLNEVKVAKL